MIGNEKGIYLREWFMYAKFAGTEKARQDNLVALSFDDGPHHYNTPNVIEILNENNAQGTFFWIAENALSLSKTNPKLFRCIILGIKNKGHEIGLHAPNDFKPTLSSRIFGHFTKGELQKAKETLENLTGINVTLYRPHHVQLGSSIVYAKELGLTTVIGDIFRTVRADDPIQAQVKTLGRAKAGSILLLHDGLSVSQNTNHILKVLPESIRLLKDNGLNPTSVSNVLKN